MTTESAQQAFEKFISQRGQKIASLIPFEGVHMMLDFYRQERAINCSEEGGDMLLYQWGTNDWGAGRFFEINITRQFIETDEEDDDAISQLSLTFHFHPAAKFDASGEGNQWCHGLDELTSFTSVIETNHAFKLTAGAKPDKVTIVYSYV